jgi:endoglucanase
MGITSISRRRMASLVALALMGSLVAVPAAASPAATGDDLYVPPPNHGAIRQIAELTAQNDKASADLIRAMIDTPQAVWFTAGTPQSVERDVRLTVTRAVAKRSVPVLVALTSPSATAPSSRPVERPPGPSTRRGSMDSRPASATAQRS